MKKLILKSILIAAALTATLGRVTPGDPGHS